MGIRVWIRNLFHDGDSDYYDLGQDVEKWMTNLLLFLILVVQGVSLFLQSRKSDDFTKEDEAVKLATEGLEKSKESVEEAIQQIPSDKQPTKE